MNFQIHPVFKQLYLLLIKIGSMVLISITSDPSDFLSAPPPGGLLYNRHHNGQGGDRIFMEHFRTRLEDFSNRLNLRRVKRRVAALFFG